MSTEARKVYSPRYLAQWFLWCRCPSFYVHKSHIPDKLPLSLYNRLLAPDVAKRNHFRVSSFLLDERVEEIDIPEQVYFFLMVNTKHLEFLCCLLGALECGPRIRATISGADVRQLKSFLGPDIFSYVTKRYNGFYKGSTRWNNLHLKELPDHVTSMGWSILKRAGQALPPEFLPIWQMRLPKDTKDYFDSSLSAEEAYELCLMIIRELMT